MRWLAWGVGVTTWCVAATAAGQPGPPSRLSLRAPEGYRWSLLGEGPVPGPELACVAPCTLELPAGPHELTVTKPGSTGSPSARVVVPAGEAVLRGRYVDATGSRRAGPWLIVGSVAILPLAVFMFPLVGWSNGGDTSRFGAYGGSEDNFGILVGVATLSLAGVLGGVLLSTRDDRVELTFEPVRRTAAVPAAPRF
jgi:hypothetical protein